MTIYDIKLSNQQHGKHFFSPGALRFFRSRIGQTIYEGPGGVYFVTSEQFHVGLGYRAARGYTVRRFSPDTGRIETVGEFNILSKSQARRLARQLAKRICV